MDGERNNLAKSQETEAVKREVELDEKGVVKLTRDEENFLSCLERGYFSECVRLVSESKISKETMHSEKVVETLENKIAGNFRYTTATPSWTISESFKLVEGLQFKFSDFLHREKVFDSFKELLKKSLKISLDETKAVLATVGMSEDILRDPMFRDPVRSGIISDLTYFNQERYHQRFSDIADAKQKIEETRNFFRLSQDEYEDMLRQAFLGKVNLGFYGQNIKKLIDFITEFDLPKSVFSDPKFLEKRPSLIFQSVFERGLDKSAQLVSLINMDKEEGIKILKEAFYRQASIYPHKAYQEVSQAKAIFSLTEEEMKELVLSIVGFRDREHYDSEREEAMGKIKMEAAEKYLKPHLHEPEVLNFAERFLLENLYDADKARKICAAYQIPEDFLKSPEFYEAGAKTFTGKIESVESRAEIDEWLKFVPLSREILVTCLEKSLLAQIPKNSFEFYKLSRFVNILEIFPEEVRTLENSQELIKNIREQIRAILQDSFHGGSSNESIIKEFIKKTGVAFNVFQEESLLELASDILTKNRSSYRQIFYGIFPRNVEILAQSKLFTSEYNLTQNNYRLTPSEMKDAARIALLRNLKNVSSEKKYRHSLVLAILDNYPLSEEELNSPDLKDSAEKCVEGVLSAGKLDEALEIMTRFNPSADFLKQPEQKEKIGKILGEQFLARGEIEDLNKKINTHGFSEDIYPVIDSSAVNHADLPKNLSKFICYLGDEDFAKNVPQTFERVKELIFTQLTQNLDLADYFIENLDNYYQQPWVAENVAKAIQQYSVAQKFINAVQNYQITWKNEPWVVDVFSQAQKIVEEHKKQFPHSDDDQEDSYGYSHGAEGFTETDPYETHLWRFTAKEAKLSSVLVRAIDGYTEAVQELSKLGFNLTELGHILPELNEKIEEEYKNFIAQFRGNPNIKDDDKSELLNPGSLKMTPLVQNVRAFVARYIIQKIEGNFEKLFPANLLAEVGPVIEEGFRRYTKALEIDVPLYDKLYQEFDTLRETGRYPLEVYLGRDGIYAWIGRRAQDVSRRRKVGLKGRKNIEASGEVLEIHPQYTVYPRYFRDNLNYETKRKFLEQEGISPDADPLFYDTGYTGTIPEQIMRVMDFDGEDIERRIRLLSAPTVHRRVKGIPENARSEIIEYIEHNAKTEETAEGLIIDEKTGKIRHIAKPTNPEEQFYFMMVKQAISRHYWLQEKLYHEPSGDINLDSEHYTIRIRQDYDKLLPLDFIHDPQEFFAKHAELLKGSEGQGEYPDEEVLLFKLTDGTEIVAKRIELRKVKEARKEFSILIAAKKAGLPTAEPVGFLTGKEETEKSYLLMKKLGGVSGRNLDRQLKKMGKFNDEQIKEIMQTVAKKNKEMAELFREKLKIDKRWRIKDTIIEFNQETGEVGAVIPIDWERVQDYDSNNPKEIDEI